MRKLDYYRIYTQHKNFKYYQPANSERYAKVLKQAADHKMPELARGIYAIPEHFHTRKSGMLQDEGVLVFEADEEGMGETDDPYIAADILKMFPDHAKLDKACADQNPAETVKRLEAEKRAKATK